MFKILTASAIAAASLAAPVLAASSATEAEPTVIVKDPRYLQVASETCDLSREQMIDWAADADGYGAYAVPVYTNAAQGDCANNDTLLPVGMSSGFDDQQSADMAALEQCESTLPDGFKSCALVGRTQSNP